MAISMDGVFNFDACINFHDDKFNDDKFNAEIERCYKKVSKKSRESIRSYIIRNFLGSYNKDGYTATVTRELVDYMPTHSNGIVYTGRNDGRCVAIFNMNNYYPISYKPTKSGENGFWLKVSKDELEEYIKYNTGKPENEFLSKQRSDFLSLQLGTSPQFSTQEAFEFSDYLLRAEQTHHPVRIDRLVQQNKLKREEVLYNSDSCALVYKKYDAYHWYLAIRMDEKGLIHTLMKFAYSETHDRDVFLAYYEANPNNALNSDFFSDTFGHVVYNFSGKELKNAIEVLGEFPSFIQKTIKKKAPLLNSHLTYLYNTIAKGIPTNIYKEYFIPYFYTILKEITKVTNENTLIFPTILKTAYVEYVKDNDLYSSSSIPNGYYFPWEYINERPELLPDSEELRDHLEDPEIYSEEQRERARGFADKELEYAIDNEFNEFQNDLGLSSKGGTSYTVEKAVMDRVAEEIAFLMVDTTVMNQPLKLEATRIMELIIRYCLVGITDYDQTFKETFVFAKYATQVYEGIMDSTN